MPGNWNPIDFFMILIEYNSTSINRANKRIENQIRNCYSTNNSQYKTFL